MEKTIPRGTQCFKCKTEIKKGDENIYYFKEDDHYLCDECAKRHFKTEVYQRVVGYMRPRDATNPGKRAEIDDRVEFNVTK